MPSHNQPSQSHGYPQFLDAAGAIDPKRVVLAAIKKARRIRSVDLRVASSRPGFVPASPRILAREALTWAREEAQAAHRIVVALPAFRARLDPVERELRAFELEVEKLRARLNNAPTLFHRRFILDDMKALEARIDELRAGQAEFLQAAE